MRARLRGPGGASTITLADDATVGDLLTEIVEKTSIPSFDIKYGYPPKPLRLEQSEPSRPLKELDVKLDGEQLTISQKEGPAVPTSNNQQSGPSGSLKEATPRADSSRVIEDRRSPGPVSLQRKSMESDVPELPLPERGATLGNSLFKSIHGL
jgi:ubiquitin thioesterase OTU1